MKLEGIYSVLDFGADPTGETDSTASIQRAIDAAADRGGGAVLVSPGTYLAADIKMKPHVTLRGSASWGYKSASGCILRLAQKPEARCLIDLTGAFSASLVGLELVGNGEEGGETHGVMIHHNLLGGEGGQKEEDFPTIDNCKIESFSGDAVHFYNVWAFRISDSMLRKSRNGLFFRATDGFIQNCIFASNRRWGIACDETAGVNFQAMTTACRVEWNRAGGYFLTGAGKWQITGCCFDRNFGPAVSLESNGNRRCRNSNSFAITGNIFNRNGTETEGEDSCHLMIRDIFNAIITGNTFIAGAGDDLRGGVYPKYCFVTEKLKNVLISNNVLQNSCTDQVLLDLGGHYSPDADDPNTGLVCKDNEGSIASKASYQIPGYFMPARD